MTQAPATPELVERLEDAAERHPGPPDGINRLLKQAADALEAQQARIAELEAELADVAIPSPYCEICGSCGSEGCGCEHKCKYARSHPDVVRDMDALQALADRYEKALRELADDPYQFGQRVQRMKDIARQALSSQGRHAGGER